MQPTAYLEAEQTKPNIVFILADDISRDSLGAYGNTDVQTPNMDRLATEGVRFDQAYTSVAMCAPFRQELYSGRSPWRTGTLPNHSVSNDNTKSIVHYLKPLGYRVALMGKRHIGPDHVYPFERLISADSKKDSNPKFISEMKVFLDSVKGDPFCLFIASKDGHAPYTTGDSSAYKPDSLMIPPYWLDTPELRETLVRYYAEVTNFDRLVGGVRQVLEERGLWQNTLFIVCSEQGNQLPFAKWTCYGNGLATGLIVNWPGVTPAGAVIEELTWVADLAPTLVDAAGGAIAATAFDGKSILPALHGKPERNHRYIVGAFTNCRIHDNYRRVFPIRTIRDKRFTLIYNPNFQDGITSNLTLSKALKLKAGEQVEDHDIAASWVRLTRRNPQADPLNLVKKLNHRPEFELYDRSKDPDELRNISGQIDYVGVEKRLKKDLFSILKARGDSDPLATEREFIP